MFGIYIYILSMYCYFKKELILIYKFVLIYICYNYNLLCFLFNEIEVWNMFMNMVLYFNDVGLEFFVLCNSGNNVYWCFLFYVFKNNI